MHRTISTRQMQMVCKRGGIYLANFNPSKGTEPGKVRPCIAMQSNLLNEAGHPSTTVLPLTTQLTEDAEPLRYRVAARDGLESDSDIMLDQTRTIDNRRITSDMLTILTEKEISEVEAYWRIVLGLD
jgi:mRNA interferase MazF